MLQKQHSTLVGIYAVMSIDVSAGSGNSVISVDQLAIFFTQT